MLGFLDLSRKTVFCFGKITKAAGQQKKFGERLNTDS